MDGCIDCDSFILVFLSRSFHFLSLSLPLQPLACNVPTATASVELYSLPSEVSPLLHSARHLLCPFNSITLSILSQDQIPREWLPSCLALPSHNINQQVHGLRRVALLRSWNGLEAVYAGFTEGVVARDVVVFDELASVDTFCAEGPWSNKECSDAELCDLGGDRFCESYLSFNMRIPLTELESLLHCTAAFDAA